MTTLAEAGFPNLAEVAKRVMPDGISEIDIVNVMSRKTEILDDIPWQECNNGTSHKIAQAYSLPTGTWRKYNTGVPATKADVEQVEESCGMLEDESKVDRAMVRNNGGPSWRMSEDKLKKEGLSQQVSTAVFYESASSNPERIHGFAPRYGSTTGGVASSYTLSGGTNSGTNCRSIWLITWELRKVFGLFPKGTMAGLRVEDMGLHRVLDANSNAFWAWITNLEWNMGIAVEDYRYVVRFQYDPDDAEFQGNEKGLFLGMLDMLSQVYERSPQSRFYMDRESEKLLNRQLVSNDANFLTYLSTGTNGKSLGRLVKAFDGVPIRVTDSLVQETAIS